MDGKYRHSLMLICILAVFCLLALDNSAFCRTETRTSDDKILSSAYDWKSRGNRSVILQKMERYPSFRVWRLHGRQDHVRDQILCRFPELP